MVGFMPRCVSSESHLMPRMHVSRRRTGWICYTVSFAGANPSASAAAQQRAAEDLALGAELSCASLSDFAPWVPFSATSDLHQL